MSTSRKVRRQAPAWLAALGILATGCAEEPVPPEPLRPVRSQQVWASGVSMTREFPGTARADQETVLSFRVPGRIEQLPARVGLPVRAGELIALLEQADYEIALRQADANLTQARATATRADAELERVRKLWENENASQNELDAALAAARSSRAQVDAAQQSFEQARRRLTYTRLEAPVDGDIAAVWVEANENVEQGQQVVMLASGTRPEVEVAMPGVLIPQIRQGSSVQVRFDALRGRDFDAVITEVGVAATGATTFPVTVRLSRDSAEVRSGMVGRVTIHFESDSSGARLLVPMQAVGEDRQGRFVFTVEPTEEPGVAIVVRTPVEVATQLAPNGRLEILSGLEEGQEIVTAGVRRLSDGQRVKLTRNDA